MKVYFAGPDVFSRSYGVFKKQVAAACSELGLEPLFPGDEVTGTDPAAIFRDNLALIDRADAVVANLNPFRGAEPDSGTAFEVGYAHARGKILLGYIEKDETTGERLVRFQGDLVCCGNELLDKQDYKVESFGLNLNLMLSVSIDIQIGDPVTCVTYLACQHGVSEILMLKQ